MKKGKNKCKQLSVLALTAALVVNTAEFPVLTVVADDKLENVSVTDENNLDATNVSVAVGNEATVSIVVEKDGNDSDLRESIFYEECYDMSMLEMTASSVDMFSFYDGTLTLKDTNEVNWIDRLDLADATEIKEFYNILVEASDNDGIDDYLIEDTYFAEGYSIEIAAVTGHADTSEAVKEKMSEVLSQYAPYVQAAYDAFDRDHPEVFWLSGNTKCSVSTKALPVPQGGYDYTVAVNFPVKRDDFDIRATDYQSQEVIKTTIDAINTRIEALVSEVSGEGIWNELSYFNEQLTKTNQYNTSSDLTSIGHDCRECTSALEGRTGTSGPVCESYARAFKVLCDKAGVPCVLVDGQAKSSSSSSGEAHMWNYVKVADNWYAVDVTWNDPKGGSSGAESGIENEKWFLVGADTTIGGMTFIASHPVNNQASQNGMKFTNGPILSAEKCNKSELENCIHVPGEIVYTGEGEQEPACANTGLGHRECTICGETTESEIVVPALGHTGGNATCNKKAVCSICQQEYGEVDSSKHGETEVRNLVSAACETTGYTGDTYCKDCGEKLASGMILPALGHTGGNATCNKKAVCSICQQEYGEVDSSKHGETEVRNQVSAACETTGYTGDTYCKDCGKKLASGTKISALGHTGGSPTCSKKAVCSVCQQEYGEVDSSKHGETEVRNQVSAACETTGYTGDTYCKDCGEKLASGTKISALGHTGGSPTCNKKAVCSICQQEYGEVDSSKHGETEIRGQVSATCETTGYTGDTYCKDCGKKLATGTQISAIEHFYVSAVTKEPTIEAEGERTYTCTVCGARKKESIEKLPVSKGTVVSDQKTKTQYKVTKSGAKNGTVEYVKSTNKNAKTIAIPATVTIDGIKYKVTSIAKNAFKNNSKLTKVTIGSNVTTIGANAFYGCKKLKSITIKTTKLTTKTVGKYAFKGIYSKAVIKVPKSKYKSYVSLLKAKGVSKTTKFKKS